VGGRQEKGKKTRKRKENKKICTSKELAVRNKRKHL
jgi:hypothetical protein